jgi:DNA-binding NtrC family response regulator
MSRSAAAPDIGAPGARPSRREDTPMTPPLESPGPCAGSPQRPAALVVDDERPIRELVATVLRRRGLEVSTAPDGDRALALLGERPAIGLLVTDVVMPGRADGLAVAESFLAARPGGRAILMSGSVAEAEVDPARFDGRAAFLAKPFRMAALEARLEDALARAEAWTGSAGARHAA